MEPNDCWMSFSTLSGGVRSTPKTGTGWEKIQLAWRRWNARLTMKIDYHGVQGTGRACSYGHDSCRNLWRRSRSVPGVWQR